MAEEKKPDDIESILSDLDSILSETGASPAPAAEPPPAKAAPKIEALTPPPAPIPTPVPPPPKAETPAPLPPPPPKPPEPVVPPPKPAAFVSDTPRGPSFDLPAPKPKEPAAPPPEPVEGRGPQIELAPREGMIKPPDKKPEPPKPSPKLPEQKPIELFITPVDKPAEPPPEPVKPPPPPPPEPVKPPPPPEPVKPPEAAAPPPSPAPKPVEAPKPAAASADAAPAKPTELATDTPKEQIRRVCYVHTAECAQIKLAFAAFLSQAARTISKKPLFLREVLALEVGVASDANAVVQKALQAKAAAVLAVVEGWPSTKVDELSEACTRANLLFRSVASADAQKKSTAVDIIVDMMLLPGEG